MILFAITLRGSHVFHDCFIHCLITGTTDETLNRVKTDIKGKYNVEVYDFSIVHGVLVAETNNFGVKVFVEEVETFV